MITTKSVLVAPFVTPSIAMGSRPDGSPWVISVLFGAGVSVDGYGDIIIRGNPQKISAQDARARSQALANAADWVETEKSAVIEAHLTS